jgi:hypothetical protein
MSKTDRVLRWLAKNPQVVSKIVVENCEHEFETLEVEHTYMKPYAVWAMERPATEVVKFCNKCGKKVVL